MSKPSAKPKESTRPEAPPGGRLDEAISDVTVKTIRGVRAYRIVIGSIIAAMLIAAMAYSLVTSLQVEANRSLAAETHRVLEEARSEDTDPLAALPQIDALLREARGEPGERVTYKEVVAFLIQESEDAIFPEETDDASVDADPETDAAPPPAQQADPSPQLLARAKQAIETVRAEYPEDAELQHWADANLRLIESLDAERNRQAPERPFQPVLPPKKEGTSATSPPNDEPSAAPDAPAEEPASTEKESEAEDDTGATSTEAGGDGDAGGADSEEP